jgi:hypothetical protein
MDEPLGGMRGRFVHDDSSAISREAVGIRVRFEQRRAVAQFARGVPQSRHHQVELLAVTATAT